MRRLAVVLPLCGCSVSVGLHAELTAGSTSDATSSSADDSSSDTTSSEATSSAVDDGSSGDEGSSTGEPQPSGPTRYPSDVVHSPITMQIAERMLAVREAGPAQADDVFMKVGASSDVAIANLHCFAGDDVVLGEHRSLAAVLDVFRAGDAAGDSPFDRTSLATEAGRSASWAIDGDPSPLVAELDAIAPSLAFVHFGTNDMELGIDPGTALPGFHLAMQTLLDTLEQAGTVPIVVGLTKRADDPEADRWIPAYNTVLRGMAQARGLPFLDVWLAVDPLPDHGLDAGGLHLEAFDGGACVLDDAGLQHGYNMRNLIQLEALARVDATLVEGMPPGGDELPPLLGTGSADDPWQIDELPFVHDADTTTGATQIDTYGCSDSDESGPELIYELVVAQDTAVRVLVLDREGVDVDVHVLSGDADDGCIARDDTAIATTLTAGSWRIVVDSWSDGAVAYPGGYLLAVVPCDDGDPDCM